MGLDSHDATDFWSLWDLGIIGSWEGQVFI